MWLFTDFGYLLPTITEESDPMRKHDLWDLYSRDGEFTFQVRARLREHLDYYLANFAEPGTYGPIWDTPDHDYNFRVFTTQEAFAQATAKMVMAINYRNFKDQSTKFPRGKEYHDLLLDIWSASCDLNQPGGFYGPRSPENPKGYEPARRYSGWGTGTNYGRRIGDSFANIVFEEDPEDTSDDYWSTHVEGQESWDDLTEEDWKARGIIDELDRYGIDMEDWAINLVPAEFALVLPALKQKFSKKKIKRMKKENRTAFSVS